MKKSKQIIVVRKDLKMRTGKSCAQSAHASLKVVLDNKLYDSNDKAVKDWMEGSFTKICVYVNSEEELLSIYNQAKAAKLPCSLIRDAGHTEFNGVPTLTCCAIGPAWSDDIDKITGDLPLL